MGNWRDIKAKALTDIHAQFGVPAVYWTHAAGTPRLLNVRVHTKLNRIENEFTWPNTPGLLDQSPSIIFKASEIAHVHPKAFVFLSATEVYRTAQSRPPKDGYITVEVVEALAADVTGIVAVLDESNLADLWTGILT